MRLSGFLETLITGSKTVVALTGSNPMQDEVMDRCADLGEIVYLDIPTNQLTKRILERPTGYGQIVGFDPENPIEFYNSRLG